MPRSFLLLLSILATAAAISGGGDSAPQEVEIEAMMEALRSRGSSLLTNAIATSDLKYELLLSSSPSSSSSFTIFAPTDSLLYALDMVADADTYTRTLRYHVTPNCRRSFRDLQALPSPFLDTLLPHHSLLLATTATMHHNSSALAGAIMIDGVRVSAPDLFLGPTFAVHGIDGILLTGLSKYQDLDSEMDSSDGLGISFLPPAEMDISAPHLPSPSPSDGLGFPFLPPDITPLPSPSDGLGMPFLPPPETSPPIMDSWNTNSPTVPPPSSAAEAPNISTRESWNSNNQDEKKAGHGKRRKRKLKRKRKHGHHRHRGAGHEFDR